MDDIDWGSWKPGSIDPKLILDNNSNFETRRTNGVWEHRIGVPHAPVIETVTLYGDANPHWQFSNLSLPDTTHKISFETRDGVPTGKITIHEV